MALFVFTRPSWKRQEDVERDRSRIEAWLITGGYALLPFVANRTPAAELSFHLELDPTLQSEDRSFIRGDFGVTATLVDLRGRPQRSTAKL